MKPIIIPKGTIIKINGIPCELVADTEVLSATIEAYGGYEKFNSRWGDDAPKTGTKLNAADDKVNNNAKS